MARPHPLILWLEVTGITLNQFRLKNNISLTAAYMMVQPGKRVQAPKMKTLKRVEEGTHGVVTIQDQLAWFEETTMPEVPKETENV